MNSTQFPISLRKRLLGILLGFTIILWLPVEDTDVTIALLFAISLCAWQINVILSRLKNQSPFPLRYFILLGALAGAAITPIAILLLVFKIGMHAHSCPDYTNQQIISLIERTPIWLAGGFFISTGLGIRFLNHQTLPESQHAADS